MAFAGGAPASTVDEVPLTPHLLPDTDVAAFADAAHHPFDLRRLADPPSPFIVASTGAAFINTVNRQAVRGPLNVLDMPIKLPGGPVRLPASMPGWVRELVDQVLVFDTAHVGQAPGLHIYLTVHQSLVVAGATQRTRGAHIDGLQGVAYPEKLPGCRSYLWSTTAPTTFHPYPFDMTGVDVATTNVFTALDRQRDPGRSWTPPAGALVATSCYAVHEAGAAAMTGWRTFARVELSHKRFDRDSNTRNPDLDTSHWNYRPRPIPTHLR